MRERAVYRDGYLHLLGYSVLSNQDGNKKFRVSYHRIKLSIENGQPRLSYDRPDFRKAYFYDIHDDKVSMIDPVMQVNASGDVLIVYGSNTFTPSGIEVGAKRSLWRHDSLLPENAEIWREGKVANNLGEDYVKALGNAVDPKDNHTIWSVHKFADPDGKMNTVIGPYTP